MRNPMLRRFILLFFALCISPFLYKMSIEVFHVFHNVKSFTSYVRKDIKKQKNPHVKRKVRILFYTSIFHKLPPDNPLCEVRQTRFVFIFLLSHMGRGHRVPLMFSKMIVMIIYIIMVYNDQNTNFT